MCATVEDVTMRWLYTKERTWAFGICLLFVMLDWVGVPLFFLQQENKKKWFKVGLSLKMCPMPFFPPPSPAIMLSVVDIRWSTSWISPTSVHACRLRTLFLRMAVKMLQTSAWHVGSHLSSSSTMHTMLSGSWMMKFISRSNWPPTSWGEGYKGRGEGRNGRREREMDAEGDQGRVFSFSRYVNTTKQ